MIDNNFTLLKPFLGEFESIADNIVEQWVSRKRVFGVLIGHQIGPKFFRDHFGVKVYAYLIDVIKGKSSSGNCPVIHIMLKFFETKQIKIHELYAICSELKNIILFHFTENMYARVDDEVFWKLSDLLDANFMGMLKEYMDESCSIIYGCENKFCGDTGTCNTTPKKVERKHSPSPLAASDNSKTSHQIKSFSNPSIAKEVLKEESSNKKKEGVNHRFVDIRYSKEERYDSDSLFEMLDETVIDKIEQFMDELNELLMTLYDAEEADAEQSAAKMGEVIEVFNKFYTLIDSLTAFPVIVRTFKNLSYFLTGLGVEDYERSEQKNILMQHLIGIVNDLEKWMDIVFIQKIADDVHYLDASFANNIVEIEAIFTQQEIVADDEDDLEFF